MLTLDELKASVPKNRRTMITQGVVDTLNQLASDEGEDFAEHYKQNFLSLSQVMSTGAYAVKDYMNAIKFVAHKLLDNSDIDAYMLTFPDRYQRLMTKWNDLDPRMSEETIRGSKISPFVTAYRRNELVMKLAEQALLPSKILNAPKFQDALNVQYDRMYNSIRDQDRIAAAESVLKYTAPNEVQKFELEVGIKGQDEIQSLRDEMQRLALQQQTGIKAGTNTSLEIAESRLLYEDAEVIEGDIDA